MSLINHPAREISCKIVYYGPGLCGKTTNLEYIHAQLDAARRGKLVSLATETDRTFFFDFLPIDSGDIGGFKVRFHLYTVPGQSHYNESRKLILRGADGVVFVADSQAARLESDIESLQNLRENLLSYSVKLENLPFVIQYNKRDLPDAVPVGELQQKLNPEGIPSFPAIAIKGEGVFDTLNCVTQAVYQKLNKGFGKR